MCGTQRRLQLFSEALILGQDSIEAALQGFQTVRTQVEERLGYLRELEERGVVTRTVVSTMPPNVEYELTENWYHDAYRADFECFMGRCGPFNPAELAHFISTRTAVAYQQGMRFAAIKRDFLCERHFALRARGYGLMPEPKARSWEAGRSWQQSNECDLRL